MTLGLPTLFVTQVIESVAPLGVNIRTFNVGIHN